MRAWSSEDTRVRLCQGAVAISLAAWVVLLWHGLHRALWFDDSYMFYRYAMNMRRGLGISWNLDGVHTYGQTAPLWGFAILALPLSFYAKGVHGYEGYAKYWHPTVSLADFLSGCVESLLLLVVLSRRQDWRMVLTFLLPFAGIAVYLHFVLQIMNYHARYYLPRLAR